MNSTNQDILFSLYNEATGTPATEIEAISGSGSNRLYFKIIGATGTLIGVIGESVDENRAFIYLSRHFAEKGLPVPRVLAISDDETAYVQDYLGDRLLFDAIAEGRATGRFSEAERDLLAQAMRTLAAVQYLGAEGLDFSKCYPQPEFDRRSVMWDLNYFKYCFLKLTGIDFNEARLEDDFNRLADRLLDNYHATFMYRDFQSRNLMVGNNGSLWLIDFQGGRRGPATYDVASFLWQARAKIPQSLRMELVEVYLSEAAKYAVIDRAQLLEELRLMVLFRMMQVLGAYGFRGLHERKQHFIDSIPPALLNIRELLATPLPEYPTLAAALALAAEKFLDRSEYAPGLTVTVTSFSYKKGVPIDESGNGGGFVFDCRGMHNPGRYDEYKPLTGRDLPVIEFLESSGEVQRFLRAAHEMVDPSVETYLRRGFSSLCVSFGCTGGRHRSVYCAEHLARELKSRYSEANIVLIHREQNIIETIL